MRGAKPKLKLEAITSIDLIQVTEVCKS
jgi:sugar lactone lactonase YvrE